MDVYLNHKRLRLKSSQLIGKGGEADIYDLGKGQALKLFKQPDHPAWQRYKTANSAGYTTKREPCGEKRARSCYTATLIPACNSSFRANPP